MKALQGGKSINSSVPSVVQPYPLPVSISDGGVSSLPSSPISSVDFIPKPIDNVPTTSNYPMGISNSSYNSTTPSSSPSHIKSSNEQSPRDQNLQKRVSDLTLERSEIAGKLFKQERLNEELTTQNNQLRQRISSLETQSGNSKLLQDRMESLESKNRELIDTIEKLREQHHQEKEQWNTMKQNFENNGSSIDVLQQEKSLLEEKLNANLQNFQEVSWEYLIICNLTYFINIYLFIVSVYIYRL